jgi:hypothetical protein
MFVDEEVPDFFTALSGVERFVLRITYPAEFVIGNRWLGAVALAHQLYYAFAVIDFIPQH